MIEQPDLFTQEQLAAAARAILNRWQHCPDDRNGWSTFDSVEADLADVERRGLLEANLLEEMRAFFSKRRVDIEADRF